MKMSTSEFPNLVLAVKIDRRFWIKRKQGHLFQKIKGRNIKEMRENFEEQGTCNWK